MTKHSSNLNGKVVAITGGARGIGDAIARTLAASGAKVVIGDLDVDTAKHAAESYDGLALPLDVSDRGSFAEFLDGVVKEHGRIDVLINNAGFMVIGRVKEVPLERQLAQIDVNLKGVVQGCYEAVDRMERGATIINIASLAGRIAMPGGAVYSATKFGVLGFSEALDAELAPRGIRVSAILPSFTNTELIAGTKPTSKLAKIVEPEDVAAAVVSVIAKPRPFTTVPRMLGLNGAMWNLTASAVKPRLRDAFGLSTMFTEFDPAKRAAYIERTDDDVTT